jgi:hypothetical protein
MTEHQYANNHDRKSKGSSYAADVTISTILMNQLEKEYPDFN